MVVTQEDLILYNPVVNKNSLLLGTGSEIIITGWTPKEKVFNKLKSLDLDFAVIGNMYNPDYGLEQLFINLLANPYNWTINTLEELRQDLTRPAVDALHNFFIGNYYLHNNRYVITNSNKDVIGGFDNLFTAEQLTWLKTTYGNLNRYYRLTDLVEGLAKRNKTVKLLQKLRESVVITIPKMITNNLPARSISHHIIEETIEQAYLKALYLVMNHGKENSSSERKEIIGLTSCITNEPSLTSADSKNTINDGLSNYIDTVINAQPKSSISYVYGDRIRNYNGTDQVDRVVTLLSQNPFSTRLYIDLWDISKDLGAENPPCLTNVWVKLNENKLILTALFRSQDIYGAYIPNLKALKALQDLIVSKVNHVRKAKERIESGAIFTTALSAHVYSSSYTLALDKLSNVPTRKKTYNDPVGNFIVKWEKSVGPLVVEQLDPNGQLAKVYIGNNSITLINQIIDKNPSIDRYHIAYLVHELIKAQTLAVCYVQDK